jgi:6-pyruvoyltetrahydropterin/6-carboxytetrahydropterin synthase
MPPLATPLVSPVVSLARRAYFSAGRVLRREDWSENQNRAAYGKDFLPHGHDYIVTVFYAGTPREEDGMIVNLSDIKPVMARVLAPLDGAWLSDLPAFASQPPTLENLVNFLWSQFPSRIESGTLAGLCLQETSRCWIEKNSHTMKLTRQYEFAAAHRLHAPTLSDEENCARYGKCNNVRGHGHNYRVEVTLEGESDESGVLLAAHVFDQIVDEEVFDRFDHKHLNEDCPEFETLIPTSENLARVIFDKLQARIAGLDNYHLKLAKIGLHETQKNYFEVEA